MNKTLDDYMNDPEIINEPAALREVHAIRLKIYDETKKMTTVEKTEYYRKKAGQAMKNFNLNKPLYAIEPASPAEMKKIDKRIKEYDEDPSCFVPYKNRVK